MAAHRSLLSTFTKCRSKRLGTHGGIRTLGLHTVHLSQLSIKQRVMLLLEMFVRHSE